MAARATGSPFSISFDLRGFSWQSRTGHEQADRAFSIDL
jgi:hypothetical protein